MAFALAILCATSAQAQDTKMMDKGMHKEHGCMMMSDSVSKTLGLNVDQFQQVKASDDRCMKACEKSAATTGAGKMDHAAMAVHDGEMKKILTAEQYVKWSAMCNMSKVEKDMKEPHKY
jgi:hypothetical protein